MANTATAQDRPGLSPRADSHARYFSVGILQIYCDMRQPVTNLSRFDDQRIPNGGVSSFSSGKSTVEHMFSRLFGVVAARAGTELADRKALRLT